MVDAFATDKGVNQPNKKLVQSTRSDPAGITRNWLSPVGPVVVRLLVAQAFSRRLPNPSNPPLPSC